MEKSLYEQNGGTYRQVGDYFLPNITIPAEEIEPSGVPPIISFNEYAPLLDWEICSTLIEYLPKFTNHKIICNRKQAAEAINIIANEPSTGVFDEILKSGVVGVTTDAF